MLGDVIGRPGRYGVAQALPDLRRKHQVDLVIANGENLAGGRGITAATGEELLAAGVDVITSGNHIFDQREAFDYLNQRDVPILRPLNYPSGAPGRGYLAIEDILVVNLSGRLFLANLDCPFRGVDRLLAEMASQFKVIIVDFHAEATSEKVVMGWYLDGRVSAVLGTHTHVPSADARILPKGTAHVSDVGMVGPRDSVLGMKTERAVAHFVTQLPVRFAVGDGPIVLNSVLLEVDRQTGKATTIFRIDEIVSNESGNW